MPERQQRVLQPPSAPAQARPPRPARTAHGHAEQARAAAGGLPVEHHVDVFSRHTQHLGLLVVALGTGIALGVLLSVLFAVLHRRQDQPEGWRKSLALGASAFFGVYLVPFLRYPANPPGVGDPGMLDQRTHAYLVAVVIGVIGAALANKVFRDLHRRGAPEPIRQLAVTAVVLATVALTFVLPANSDALTVPAGLLWQFRLLALATSALLWETLSVVGDIRAASSPRRSPAVNRVASTATSRVPAAVPAGTLPAVRRARDRPAPGRPAAGYQPPQGRRPRADSPPRTGDRGATLLQDPAQRDQVQAHARRGQAAFEQPAPDGDEVGVAKLPPREPPAAHPYRLAAGAERHQQRGEPDTGSSPEKGGSHQTRHARGAATGR